MPFFTHNIEVMLNDELKPNFVELLRTSANLSAPTAGWGAEFCSCVESVLAIGHLQLQKGVLFIYIVHLFALLVVQSTKPPQPICI